MKIPKSDYNQLLFESDWGEEPYPEMVETWKDLVAKDCNIDKKRVRLWWCQPVEEYCIYIDNKWNGYFETDKYFRGEHWSGWDNWKDGVGGNNVR